MLIGLAVGVFGQSQIWKGMLGGFIGGAIGGILLEGVRNWLTESAYRQSCGPGAAGRFRGRVHLLDRRTAGESLAGSDLGQAQGHRVHAR